MVQQMREIRDAELEGMPEMATIGLSEVGTVIVGQWRDCTKASLRWDQ
jgi:hypothetical protein